MNTKTTFYFPFTRLVSRRTRAGLFLLIASGLMAAAPIAPAEQLIIEVESFESQTIYHSPQTPGYTSWLGAWINPDYSLTASFTQATGPIADPPNRDFSSLEVINKYFQSTDGGDTWALYREDAALAPNGLSTHPVAMNAQATIALSDGTLIRRVNGEDVSIVDDSVVGTAYLERSAPDSTTWENPIYLVDPETFTYQVSRIRKLRDGRLITTGQVWTPPAGQRRAGTPVNARMMVSCDEGLTWTDALTFSETEPYMYPNEWDTAELPNGDLLSVWRSRSLENPGNPTQVRNQALLQNNGAGWTMTNVQPAPFLHSGHPELLATQEGVVLH
nr:glycoside hydrolase [Verrucomicrobiota bacterium]